MKQKIVLATGNKGKVKEMADVLSDFGFEVIAQTDLGIESPEETGLTFVENALLKARYALMNPLMILVKIIKLRWIHILSYDQMVSRKINNQTTRCAN